MSANLDELYEKFLTLSEEGDLDKAVVMFSKLDTTTRKAFEKRLRSHRKSGGDSWDKGNELLVRIFGGGEPSTY